MIIKSRKQFKTQWDWLYYLQNNLGNNELSIQTSKRLENGDIIFFKRYNFLELQYSDPFEKLPINLKGTYFKTRTQIIEEASHRTIMDIELCIDIDEAGECGTIKEKAIQIKKRLDKVNANYQIYWTGSKSYHIHVYEEKFRCIDKAGRNKLKRLYLTFLGADSLKNENNLIALEGACHYKSGIPKQEVKL